MKKIYFLLLTGVAIALGGCASSKSGDVYTRDQARKPLLVKMGVVESVRMVKIEGTKSAIGPAAGAVVGGIAGSDIGGGKGSAVGAVLGSVAGGVVGAAAEEGFTRQDGVEVTVRLENGEVIAVVQEARETFNVGDRVRILEGDGVTRVSH
ncbi:MAG TPA: glycine zipper 2TM domain-containing protein [Gallionella sp.]|jgi:outer membrane lipoprotein SlyB|nr:glycine zipper 2TM domain-containing protein [Gallionella sp.]